MTTSSDVLAARREHEVEVIGDLRIPTATASETLAAKLYRPLTSARVPVLITLVPYRRDAAAGLMYGPYLHRFARAGFACVLVDFRGTGSSDGLQRPPFDPGEADDGIAAIEWAAKQPWSTGSVGMWGHSYGAITSIRTAARRPSALKAILPVMGMTDPERDFVHPSGQRGAMASLATWGLLTLMNQLLPPLSEYAIAREQARWIRRIHDVEPWFVQLHQDGPGAQAWASRAIDASLIETPAFFIAGWRDLFCAGTLRAYEQATGPKKLMVGPWMHTMPNLSPNEPIDFHSLAVQWWDAWLRGTDSQGCDLDVALYLEGESKPWRRFPTWPKGKSLRFSATTGSTTGAWNVPSAGLDAEGDDRVASRLSPLNDAEGDSTVGSLGGLWSMPCNGWGLPLDQHDDDMRSLATTSEPLPRGLTIAGRPRVVLVAPTDITHRMVVRLTDVDERGRSTLISSGISTVGAVPGEWSVELEPTAYRVAAGHRIRVSISGGDFPRLWPNASADQSVIALRRLDLAVPALEGDQGSAALISAAPEDEGATEGASKPKWSIKRDPIKGTIEVLFGNAIDAVTEDSIGYHEDRTVIACAGPSLPPRIEGIATYTAAFPAGDVIHVNAAIHITDAFAVATAEVKVNDTLLVSRNWRTPICFEP